MAPVKNPPVPLQESIIKAWLFSQNPDGTFSPATLGGGSGTTNLTGINGVAPGITNPLAVELSDGSNPFGTFANPLSVNVLSGGGSNASVGATGAAAPTSATEIGIIDGTGKLQGASATNPVPENVAQWGGTAVAPAATTAPAGTEAAPIVRNIPRKSSQILTTTPLGASSNFTSAWQDTQITGSMYVNVTIYISGGSYFSNTLLFQGTDDQSNSNMTVPLMTTTPLAGLNTYALTVKTRYWRVSISNSAAQAAMEISATDSPTASQVIVAGLGTGQVSQSNLMAVTEYFNTGLGDSPGSGIGQVVTTGGQVVIGGSASYVATGPPQTAANLVVLRTPNIFKTVAATAAGNTALWTPTTGKKFRLMRFMIQLTEDAKQAVAGNITVTFQDNTTGINFAVDVWVPASSGSNVGDAYHTDWIDFGNGILSAAANNVLNVNLSAALTAGNVRVNVCGTEE